MNDFAIKHYLNTLQADYIGAQSTEDETKMIYKVVLCHRCNYMRYIRWIHCLVLQYHTFSTDSGPRRELVYIPFDDGQGSVESWTKM
jgi:hypothetical protein